MILFERVLVGAGGPVAGPDVSSQRRLRSWVRQGKGFGYEALDGRLVVIRGESGRSASSRPVRSES